MLKYYLHLLSNDLKFITTTQYIFNTENINVSNDSEETSTLLKTL